MLPEQVRWTPFKETEPSIQRLFLFSAALAGKEDDADESEDEFAEIEELERRPFAELALLDKAKLYILKLLRGYGFVGIVICASVGKKPMIWRACEPPC